MTDILDSNVLVLNKAYTPISLTTVRDAICTLWSGHAEVVFVNDQGAYEGYDFHSWADISAYKELFEGRELDWIHTPSKTLIVPRVIRTLHYDKVQAQTLKPTRKNIYDRDGNTCQYCNKKRTPKELNLDHVVPLCQGGRGTWTNLVCTCIPCNSKKGGHRPEEVGMKLIRKPVAPPPHFELKLSRGVKVYKDWDSFVSFVYWNTPLEE